jgi:hypothetical protein
MDTSPDQRPHIGYLNTNHRQITRTQTTDRSLDHDHKEVTRTQTTDKLSNQRPQAGHLIRDHDLVTRKKLFMKNPRYFFTHEQDT